MFGEVFADDEPTPQEKAMMKALMTGGMLKYVYTEDGRVEVQVIPVHDLYPDAPKDPQ
jgi:hypothetical protein